MTRELVQFKAKSLSDSHVKQMEREMAELRHQLQVLRVYLLVHGWYDLAVPGGRVPVGQRGGPLREQSPYASSPKGTC